MIEQLTPTRVLLAAVALLILGLASGFAIRSVFDALRPGAPSFEVVDTGANCPDPMHCRLIVHVRNHGGTGTGGVRLTADGAQRNAIGVSPGAFAVVRTTVSCIATIPRAEPGDVVEASCAIGSLRSPTSTLIFIYPTVAATIIG